jgi:hypothetical protein
MRECTEELFLKDIADHKMTVLHDDGLYRSLRFARQGEHSWWNWFTITTWPGYLCINGDMGCFVFSRIEDMFEFFRSTPEGHKGLHINTGYWHEKLEADDRRVGSEVYDEKSFKEAVKHDFDQHEFYNEEEKVDCWERVEDEVLCAENEYEAHRNASDFFYDGHLDRFYFADFWEHDLKSYTFQYVWCCYAIVWAIQQYDLSKKPS